MATAAPVAPGPAANGDAASAPSPAPAQEAPKARSGFEEVIPGVLRDADTDTPRVSRKRERGERRAAALPPEVGAEVATKPAEAPAEGEEPAGEPQEAAEGEGAEPFEFAGKTFKSREAAEQEFKTWLGRGPKLQKQLSETEKARDEAAALAWRWHEVATKGQTQESGQGVADAAVAGSQEPAPKGAAFDPAAAVKAIDWRMHAKIREEHGEDVASYWLAEKLAKGLHEGFRSEIEAIRSELSGELDPIRTERATRKELDQQGALFDQVSSLVLDGGSPAYPELNEDAAAEEIGWIYSQLPLTPEAKLTPQAVQTAVLIYRGRKAEGRAPVTAALPEPPVRRPPGEVLSGRAAPPPSGRAPAESRDTALKRGIREAGAIIPHLGFAP